VVSHERASPAKLEAEVRTVSQSPIVSALLEAVDAGLLVLNRERQILATNRAPLLENLRHARRSIGLRPGEFFACPRAAEQPQGCGRASIAWLVGPSRRSRNRRPADAPSSRNVCSRQAREKTRHRWS